MDSNLLEHLPPVLQDVKELQRIFIAEDPEVDKLSEAVDAVLLDQFISDATAYGVGRWESILKILPKDTDSLQERKFRILARINEQLPYSMRMLLQQLNTLCGEDGYTVELRGKEYTLLVKVALIAKSNFADVGDLLGRIVPANMIIDLSLKYNQHQTLKKFTHGQLKRYTHTELRNEVIT